MQSFNLVSRLVFLIFNQRVSNLIITIALRKTILFPTSLRRVTPTDAEFCLVGANNRWTPFCRTRRKNSVSSLRVDTNEIRGKENNKREGNVNVDCKEQDSTMSEKCTDVTFDRLKSDKKLQIYTIRMKLFQFAGLSEIKDEYFFSTEVN